VKYQDNDVSNAGKQYKSDLLCNKEEKGIFFITNEQGTE